MSLQVGLFYQISQENHTVNVRNPSFEGKRERIQQRIAAIYKQYIYLVIYCCIERCINGQYSYYLQVSLTLKVGTVQGAHFRIFDLKNFEHFPQPPERLVASTFCEICWKFLRKLHR